jgi:UDP-N-acetylglucosamine 3-dehydrogenase
MPRGLVVGLGLMGSRHLRVLNEMDGATIPAAVDLDKERRARAQHRYPELQTYETIAAALAAHELDFACIAAPAGALAALAHEALAAGLAVMVEKPLATDDEAALAVVLDAERRGLLLAVGQVERCNPAVIALKHRLDAGEVGRIYQLHARRLSPFPDRDPKVGVALDLATHDIDVMRYLSGGEIARVSAETDRRLHDSAEDLIAATLRFEDGIIGLLEVNWLTPSKVRELTVTGEGGTFVLNYATQDLYFYAHPTERTQWDVLASMRGAGEGDMVRYALERREPLQVQWEGFLTALQTGDAPVATGRDGFAALSTARAIQRSGTDHVPVVPAYRAAAWQPAGA